MVKKKQKVSENKRSTLNAAGAREQKSPSILLRVNSRTKGQKSQLSAVGSAMETMIQFPGHLVKPIADFLWEQTQKLEWHKKKIATDDPFEKIDRGDDKAAPDKEVTDRFRHESLSAVREQIDRRLVQIRKAMSRIKIGKYGICENCSRMIDTDRLMVYPEATLCVECERILERKK